MGDQPDHRRPNFVAAWRHIHDLFDAAGATNVIWVWNPNIINPVPGVQLEPLWPGGSYVDWVGMTGYFAVTGPHTFDGALRADHDRDQAVHDQAVHHRGDRRGDRAPTS